MKKILILLSILSTFSLPLIANAAVTFPVNGGTGSTTLTGILVGNATSPINTLTIGTNLTLVGTTLNATGGSGSGGLATTSLMASSPIILTITSANATFSWSGLATTTNLTAGHLLESGGGAGVFDVATSTLTPSSPLTGSFVQIGSSGSLGCQTASGSQAGCLSSTDWTTFNNKGSGTVTSVTGTYPIISSGGTTPAISTAFGTTTNAGIGNDLILYTSHTGVIIGTATSTLNIGGNAGTATALQNARTINGVSFNGTANIVVASTTLLASDNNTFSGNTIFAASTTFQKQINAQQASTTLLGATANVYFPGLTAGAGNGSVCRTTGGEIEYEAGANCITGSSASSTLLGDNNTFSGTDTFNNTISGSVSGNAGTATALQNARTINGVSFNGTANIVVSSTTLLASDNNTFSGNTTFVASTTFQKQINAQGASTTLLSAVTGWIGMLNLTNPLTVANGGTGLTSTSQNFFFAGPTSGSGAPTWRAIVAGDIPTLNQNTSGSAGSVANSLSNDGATLTGSSFNGSSAVSNWAINLTHPNSWTGLQNFTGNASSSIFSVNVGPLYVGGVTATTTITANATSTFATGLNLTTGCVTYQGGLCLGAAGTFIGGTSLAVQLATTGALPANTYAGGVLTEVGTGALTVDGTSAAVGNRILVKNEVAQTNNGIYSVTAAGSGIAAYVLTRVSDYNSSANVYPGEATYVINGSTLADDWWALTTAAPITVGGGGSGSNLTYVETSAAASGVISVSCPGGFLTCSGTNPATFTLGTLGITNGGTGLTSIGASSTVLTTNGTSAAWQQVSLTSSVYGLLPLANGGTGANLSSGSGNVPFVAVAGGSFLISSNFTLTNSGTLLTVPSVLLQPTNTAANSILYTGSAGLVTGAASSSLDLPNAALQNSSVTVNTASPLSGGGSVSLGGTLNLTCSTCTTGGVTTVTGTTNQIASTGGTTPVLSLPNLVIFPLDASTTELSVFNGAYFGATATSSFDSAGNLTIGTTTQSVKPLFVDGSTAGGVAVIQREVTSPAASSLYGTYDVNLDEIAGSLADQTGPAQTYGVKLNGGSENIYGEVAAFRNGADTTGNLALYSYLAGSPVNPLLLSGWNAGFGNYTTNTTLTADKLYGSTATNIFELASSTNSTGTTGTAVFAVSAGGLTSMLNASTTLFSSFGTSYFGGTATSTFNSVGTLTLQDADNGYSAIATPTRYLTFAYGTSTTMTGTSSASASPSAVAPFAGTIKSVQCLATSTNAFINNSFYVGTTAVVPDIVASNTLGVITPTSNNTFTKGQTITMLYGSSTASALNQGGNCTLSVIQTS